MEATFSQFYKRTPEQRLAILAETLGLSEAEQQILKHRATQGDAPLLIENYLTTYQLPEGVAVNLRVNDHEYVVPMVTEEPSVIAAARNGAKQLAKAGGITATVHSRLLTGQVVLSDVKVYASIDDWIALHQNELLEVAKQAHPSIVSSVVADRSLFGPATCEGFVSIDLVVDVKAAMGANMMNTMLEAIAGVVQNKLHHTTLFSILSNAGRSEFNNGYSSISISLAITDQPDKAQQVGKRIAQASRIAQSDPMRAVTHNKGIMKRCRCSGCRNGQ